MTQKEQARLRVLNSVLEHRVGVKKATCVLGLSERHHIRRPGVNTASTPNTRLTVSYTHLDVYKRQHDSYTGS